MSGPAKSLALHAGVVAVLLVLHFVLPTYHHGNLARIMVLAVYAMGFNVIFGYAGMLSLGHALFFAAGMYGMGLSMQHLGLAAGPALLAGLAASLAVSLTVGLLVLRTTGVQLMIVTLMFAQAGFLAVLYFGDLTRGDEGFVIQQAERVLFGIDLSNDGNRYLAGLLIFAGCLFLTLRLVESRFGRVLIAIRENAERARMLGYDIARYKLGAFVISGTISGVAGAFYGLPVRLCRREFRHRAVFDPAAGLGSAWRRQHGAWPVRRHGVHVLPDRFIQRFHQRLYGHRRCRSGLAHPVRAPRHRRRSKKEGCAVAAVTLLSTEGLTRRFGGVLAVSNVDFTLPAGQVRALIGPNGAGKSTFVGMLCGRIAATAGSVRFLGEDITGLPAHKRISKGMAYTFQITSLFSRLTLHENVALAVRRQTQADTAEAEARTMDALSKVGLADRFGENAGDLSYGHQRLLEIAMGLGQRPKLLILDEPTQGLADGEIAHFNSLIRSLAGTTTVLLIEHNMNVVMEMADYITVLDAGEILAEGRPEAIRGDRAVQAAYLGTG